jgi:hypothetical protein
MAADNPESRFRACEARGEVLWAMDLAPVYPGGPYQPVLAHRIVSTRQEQYRGEVRTSACGQEFTAGTHPKGWWSTPGDDLPLQRPYVHCGVPEVEADGR